MNEPGWWRLLAGFGFAVVLAGVVLGEHAGLLHAWLRFVGSTLLGACSAWSLRRAWWAFERERRSLRTPWSEVAHVAWNLGWSALTAGLVVQALVAILAGRP
jgi:hypothetical protein